MDDNKIVELYWERREEAIKETALSMKCLFWRNQ